MQPGRQIDFSAHYENLAETVARVYGNAMLLNGTSELLRATVDCYPEVFDDIDADPQQWTERVNDYLYGMAH